MRRRVGSVGVVSVVALVATFGCELGDPSEGAAGSAGTSAGTGGNAGQSGSGGRTGGTAGTGGENGGGKSAGGTSANGARGGATSTGGTGQAGRGGSSNTSGGEGGQETGGENNAGESGSGGSGNTGASGGEGGEANGGRGGTGGSAGSVSGNAGSAGSVSGAAGSTGGGAGAGGGSPSGAGGAGGALPCTPSQTEDRDEDGWTLADGDCDDCDARRHPGNFDVPANAIDDDCDGTADNSAVCDSGIASNTTNASHFARALDLCNTLAEGERGWGLVDARLTRADGTGVPAAAGHAVRGRFGTNLVPRLGHAFAVLSTGIAAGQGDTNPAPATTRDHDQSTTSGPPADFASANSGSLSQPGCPPLSLTQAHDSQMLQIALRVPENARSFSVQASFYSYDFPEYVCSQYIDLWVMLLGSAATPARTDKNLAVVSSNGRPLGVNLATGDTGLFQQCVNGTTGCQNNTGTTGTSMGCTSTTGLTGTGFGDAAAGLCNAGSLAGGATGWLTISGNVQPGELASLRVGLWDVGDHASDSTLVLDGFEWSTESVEPGAVP